MPKAYLTNIRTAWPIERQEAMLDARAPGWRDGAVYRDILPAAKRKARASVAMEERDRLTRPTRRSAPDTVTVASLAVVAWTGRDFMAFLAGLAGRHATLVSVDCGTVVPPNDAAAIATASAEFERAVQRVGDGRQSGGIVSGKRRSDVAQARCLTIKERWGMPNSVWTTTALCAEADVSKPTALKWLGPRDEAQKKYAAALATAERNRNRRKQQ